MRRPISLSILFLVILVPAAAKPQQTTFIVLGDFGGFELSGDGSLVTAGSAIIWQNGVPIDEFLGFLPGGDVPNNLGSSFTIAHDVNHDGSVIVGRATCSSALSALCPSLEQQAFRWENGIIMELGTLPGGTFSQAFGVSGDGSVVVGATDGFSRRGFRWENGTMSGLGRMRGSRVSADGLVAVGYVFNSPDQPEIEPALWEGGDVTGLGTLEDCSRARATNVSGDGSVVVGDGCGNGWRWVAGHGPGTGMSSLGLLPGATSSHPTTVSGDGSIVVGNAGYPDGFDEAFIWDETNGIRSLQDVLVNDFGVDFMGWTLTRAEDMSSDAGTIIGFARDESEQRTVYIVPEPGNLYALGAGTAFLGVLYRRRALGLRLS
jgi:probable HAF family extracellular repeat protein